MNYLAELLCAWLRCVLLCAALALVGVPCYAQDPTLDGYEQLFAGMLKEAETLFGPESDEVASSLETLALLQIAQHRYQLAEPLLVRALTIREKAQSPHLASIAKTMEAFALLYQGQSRSAEAEQAYKRVIEIERKIAPRGVVIPRVLRNLGNFYKAQKRYAEAEPLYRESLAIAEESWGPKSMGIGAELLAMAQILELLKQLAEAETLFLRVAELYDGVPNLGPDKSSEVYGSVAAFYQKQGREVEAAKFAAKAKRNNP